MGDETSLSSWYNAVIVDIHDEGNYGVVYEDKDEIMIILQP